MMAVIYRCEDGHEWEPCDDSDSRICPVCGRTGIASGDPKVEPHPSIDETHTVQLDHTHSFIRVQHSPEVAASAKSDSDDREELLAFHTEGKYHRHTINRLVGEGGLGNVYLARDVDLNRTVALKKLKPGPQSQIGLQRFVREAQVNSQLEHPNIIPIYGAVLSEHDTEPYYTMKYVKGGTLADLITALHRDESDAKFQSREFRRLLNLFIGCCHAVSYAHSRGVVHRDLKPANIAVGEFGELIVLDWGLAKLIGENDSFNENASNADTPEASDDIQQTVEGQVLGTPAYMAPEQAAGRNDEVGPTCDIYALGGILFCLLTGQTPHRLVQTYSIPEAERWSKRESGVRIIGERVQGANPTEDTIALLERVRKGHVPRARDICPVAPKAIDAICAKAMALVSEHRYDDARLLADEIERWLADEPVDVYHDPWPIRVRRWVKRHQTGVTWSVGAMLACAICLAGAVWVVAGKNAVIASSSRKLTEINNELVTKNQELATANRDLVLANKAERAARDEAGEAKRQAETVSDFLVNTFRRADPNIESREIRVVDVLKRAVTQLDAEYPQPSLTKANIQAALGETYAGLGEFGRAVTLLTEAHEFLSQSIGDNHEKTAICLNNLAAAHYDAKDTDIAIDLGKRALATLREILGSDQNETLAAQNNLAAYYQAAGDLANAIPLMQQNLASMVRLNGKDHQLTLAARNNLAATYQMNGQSEKAIPLMQESLATIRRLFGPEHLNSLIFQNNLAQALSAVGQHTDAIKLFAPALEGLKRKLGEDHPVVLTCTFNVGEAHAAIENFDEAILNYRESVRLAKSIFGERSPQALHARHKLAFAYLNNSQPTLAVSTYEEMLGEHVADPDWENTEQFNAYLQLAIAYSESMQIEKAIDLLEGMQKAINGQSDPADDEETRILLRLGLAESTHDAARAKQLLRECVARLNSSESAPPWLIGVANETLGRLALEGDIEVAESLLTSAYDSMNQYREQMPCYERARVTRAIRNLIELYKNTGRDAQRELWTSRLQSSMKE